MKKKELLRQTGTMPNGGAVYAGAFRFYETHGLPLSTVFQCFMEKGWMVDWLDFYDTARRAGMGHDRVLSMLDEAISDSYGTDMCRHVRERLGIVRG